jgi:glucose-6-phosphate isomerase
MGQYLQEGTHNFFETTLIVDTPLLDEKLKISNNIDGLKYLHNKNIDFINKKAFEGTVMAHSKLGKSHNLVIHLAKSDAYHFGYFFI